MRHLQTLTIEHFHKKRNKWLTVNQLDYLLFNLFRCQVSASHIFCLGAGALFFRRMHNAEDLGCGQLQLLAVPFELDVA